MGNRGPLKLPRHLNPVTAGDKPETAADQAKPVAPARPYGFPVEDAELSALWDDMVPILDEASMLSAADGPTVELALRHFLAARRASDALLSGDVGAMAMKDNKNGGWKKNPAGAEFRSQSLLFLEYAKQMGMSFAARARVPARKDEQGGDGNPFAAQSG